MASFGGATIFGGGVVMVTAINPRDEQVNAYPGVNGLEVLDGGSRGLVTTATGTLYGAGVGGLTAAELFFMSFYDGNAYVLVDTIGRAWPAVRMKRFQPSGRVGQSAGGVCFRSYSAEFLHLRYP